ncbi:MAG TPA: 3,4-dihydroxy-2-butanone-4-phosphate synthase [Myxococcota bacterium]|nr:3,4-dihydroxy-2-butanone-4-phosphate synthase [Myxococcota bacterium]
MQAFQNGRMVILTDDPTRENEGDLIIPAECVDAAMMNLMIRHGSGIVCLSLTKERADALQLPLMVSAEENSSCRSTPFTVSIDARTGITTGVSADDRVRTVAAAVASHALPDDLVRPGHLFPLQAHDGGVLVRQGHTEGSVDLARIAGFKPMAILCEIMNPDGTMASGNSLQAFAVQHNFVMLSISDIIHYRLMHEDFIEDSATALLPLEKYGHFKVFAMRDRLSKEEHMVLYKEPVDATKSALVRVHSSCATGDIFSSMRCDCHQALHHALERIAEEGGALIYLNQEGRGIGLLNKIKAYALQEEGLDTVEANEALGLPVDARSYYFAAHMLRHLNIKSIRLLTSNPKKIEEIQLFISSTVTQEPMPSFCNEYNERYLATKRSKLHHGIYLNDHEKEE